MPAKAPAPSPLHAWEWPDRLWFRLHIDHAGTVIGKYFLVVVDVHSKWLEVMLVPSTSTASTVQKLCAIFATQKYWCLTMSLVSQVQNSRNSPPKMASITLHPHLQLMVWLNGASKRLRMHSRKHLGRIWKHSYHDSFFIIGQHFILQQGYLQQNYSLVEVRDLYSP